MSEVHTSYHGSLLRLSDEPVQDFIGDVRLIIGLYGLGEPNDHGLMELDEDLYGAALELKDRISNRAIDPNSSQETTLWDSLVALATQSPEHGPNYLEAYQHVRLNRLLKVEFGEAETKTTGILRSIGCSAVTTAVGRIAPDRLAAFFSTHYTSFVLGSFFGSKETMTLDGQAHANEELEEYIISAARNSDITRDPAYARVLSTLISRSSSVLKKIPEEIKQESMSKNRRIFQDKGMRTPGHKPKVIYWSEDPKVAADHGTEEERVFSQDHEKQSDSDEDVVNAVGTVARFDRSLGNCHVKKDDSLDPILRSTLVKSMANMMFPSDGEGTAKAIKLCKDSCPVKDECLDYALKNRIDQGVWGGVSERGRKKILNQQESQAVPVASP